MKCRTCQSRNTYHFLSLGKHPHANYFLKESQLSQKEDKHPLDAYACLDCALIQVKNYVPSEFFRNYVYVPSASGVMVEHFSEFAKKLIKTYKPTKKDLIIDVGSNDGTFLSNFKDSGIRILGIEPARNLAEAAQKKGVATLSEYFKPEIAAKVRTQFGTAKIITATNTANNIDDLRGMMKGILSLLSNDGVFVIEIPHAQDLIKKNEFDTIYHEHLSEFSVMSVKKLYDPFGLHIANIDRLPIHGGSMRIYAERKKPKSSRVLNTWLAGEKRAGLFSKPAYDRFALAVKKNKEKMLKLLASIKKEGKSIAGYGAPAKGNTLLNYYGIGRETLDFLVDRNPLKHGLYSPGMHLKVYPVDQILKARPDYLLILAWNFKDEVIRQQNEFKKLGGKFIVPIPHPKII